MPSKILVATADLCAYILFEYNLSRLNGVTSHVERGDEVEQHIGSLTPDLLLVDWQLPGLCGAEVCRRLRRRYSMQRLPVVLLLRSDHASDRTYAEAAGANVALPRPFSIEDLGRHVARVLASKSNAELMAASLA